MLEKEEIVSPNLEELKNHYRSIITLLGEDAEREGLLKTPERVAKAMLSLTKGYHIDPHEVLRSAKFKEEYSQMVIVKDMERHTWPIFLTAISRDLVRLPVWSIYSLIACKCRNA